MATPPTRMGHHLGGQWCGDAVNTGPPARRCSRHRIVGSTNSVFLPAWLTMSGGRAYGPEIRRLRPHRAGAGAAPRSDLPRAVDPDRAFGSGRVLRVSPGRAPHARDPQPGAVPE